MRWILGSAGMQDINRPVRCAALGLSANHGLSLFEKKFDRISGLLGTPAALWKENLEAEKA